MMCEWEIEIHGSFVQQRAENIVVAQLIKYRHFFIMASSYQMVLV